MRQPSFIALGGDVTTVCLRVPGSTWVRTTCWPSTMAMTSRPTSWANTAARGHVSSSTRPWLMSPFSFSRILPPTSMDTTTALWSTSLVRWTVFFFFFSYIISARPSHQDKCFVCIASSMCNINNSKLVNINMSTAFVLKCPFTDPSSYIHIAKENSMWVKLELFSRSEKSQSSTGSGLTC